MQRLGQWIGLGLFAAVAASCGPSTKMLNSWTAPELESGSIRKVMVLGVAKNEGVRRSYEDKFVGRLKELGYDATVSYIWAPDITKPDSAAVYAKLVETGVTHVLTTRLIDKKMVETYVPPTYMSTGMGYGGYPGYYGSWGSYWSTGYTYAVDPGYTTQDLVVSLETNLYGVDKANLLWSGITETWISSDPSSNVDAVIDVTLADLRAKKIL